MVLWLIGTSLFTHYICVWITWAREKNAYACKKILTFGIVLLLTAWGYVKYFDFFVANLNRISEVTELFPKVQTIEVLLPIGVSFYTLQAIGYMIDVGRQRAEVCVHPGKTMLFLGFFPQIMEGPISSYGQTADALFRGDPIRVSNLSEGSLRILWGLFKKLIIADRLYVLVDKVFDHYTEYHGAVIAAALLAFLVSTDPGLARGTATGANACASDNVINGLVAEILLTFIFVLVVLGATAKTNGATNNFAGLAIGLSLILIHLVGINYTGTSVNPARSIGPALFEGGKALAQLWVFIVGPFIGGALAAGVWKMIDTSEK